MEFLFVALDAGFPPVVIGMVILVPLIVIAAVTLGVVLVVRAVKNRKK